MSKRIITAITRSKEIPDSWPEAWSPEYRCWTAFKQRCSNPSAAGWKNYGGIHYSKLTEHHDAVKVVLQQEHGTVQ